MLQCFFVLHYKKESETLRTQLLFTGGADSHLNPMILYETVTHIASGAFQMSSDTEGW